MYAIIETGGKQIKVEKGQEIYIEKVAGEADEVVTFDKVLFVGGEDVKVGVPFVEGATVTGKLLNRAVLKKSRFTNTSRKRTITKNKVIVSHTRKSSLTVLTCKPA